MVCCVIAAWIVGSIVKGIRWTMRTLVTAIRGSKRPAPVPASAPTPVYEVSVALRAEPLDDERDPQLV